MSASSDTPSDAPIPTVSVPPRPADTNYDERAVPPYTLPRLLVTASGVTVKDQQSWLETRRPELLELFSREMYGRIADVTLGTRLECVATHEAALGGLATHREFDLTLSRSHAELTIRLSVWSPHRSPEPASTFLGLNFYGNQTVHPDPNIRLALSWIPNEGDLGLVDGRASSASRGLRAQRWPLELIVSRGHALVAA